MLAALLRRSSGDAEVNCGFIGQHLEVIGRGDAAIEKDVLGEVARQEGQHLAEVGVITSVAEQL